MSTPALEDTHSPSASAVTVDIAAGPPPNRPIVWAGSLSALLHLLFLLTLGLASYHSSTLPSSAPELRVIVESTDGRDTEHDRAGPAERPAAPITQPNEEVLASLAGSRSSQVQSLPTKVPPSTPPTPDETPSDSTPSTGDAAPDATPSSGSVQSDSPAEESAVVTTVGVSDREESARAEAAPQRQPGVAIGSAQESVLARWIMQAAQGLQDANLTQARLSLQHKGRQYTAFLERRPAADAMDIDHVKVEITTEENGKLLRTLLQLKRLAFSHFTQLVDDWDKSDLLHADAIEGRFHSNSEIQLLYDQVAPRVVGKLTTAAVRVNIHNAGSRVLREIFRDGIETRTARIALPAAFPAFAHQGDSTNVRSFARATRVTFYSDGSYGWQEMGSNAPEQRQTVGAPHYIVASPGATISVRGTVRGTVVVYSPERIVVEGSLIYAHDPRSSPDADDYLGLISSKDIEIAPPKVTGPGDLEIQAAIYARRRFIVSDYRAPEGPTACPCAARLMICGSLTAGSLSPTEPRYATRYDFDRRFEQVRPPGFPVTNRYEVEAWDAQWREAEAQPSGGAAESVPVSTNEPEATVPVAGARR